MSLVIKQSKLFDADFDLRATWYLDQAGETVAQRFRAALDATLHKLARVPSLGRIRHFRHPKLQGFRSMRVNPPFNKTLVFYRFDETTLFVERLIHGARDLPRRLLQPPDAEDQ
jgi:toxin ParE1/3/4